MKIHYTGKPFATNGFFQLKNQDWLDKQRVAGKVVAGSLSLLENFIKNKTALNAKQLNNLAEEYIQDNHCSPTFKGYKGFPAGVCISINKELVHGIPKEYYFQEGDVISFDLGATYKSAIADSALTCIYGEPKSKQHVELIKATEEALMEAIKSIKVGNHLGCIGYTIHNYLKKNYSVITQYGGHGIGTAEDGTGMPHMPPFVSNKSDLNEGIRIQPGLVIAIEPMAVIGGKETYVDKDGWTIWGSGISAHFEHSIFVHDDYVEIVTAR